MTSPWKHKRVGVLVGGISAEREVSLNTGKGVLGALLERGYDAVAIDWSNERELVGLLRAEKIDVVWNALHGTYGEDGAVQGLLECLRIPYTGSGVLASAVAMDKIMSKKLFLLHHVPTPDWRPLHSAAGALAVARGLGFPVVVKPSREGSTVGITIVKDEEGFPAALEAARACHGEPFLERYVPGREISVGILDDAVLGSVEIRPKKAFYDYAAKYLSGDTEYVVPAPLETDAENAVFAAGRAAHLALSCQAYSRVDLRLDEQGKPWVLEVNTLPGMTGTSLLPKIARHAGLDYAALVERILLSASLRE